MDTVKISSFFCDFQKKQIETELDIALGIVDMLLNRFNTSIMEKLATLGLVEYNGEDVTKELVKNTLKHLAQDGNFFQNQHFWTQAYTIVLVEYDSFKKYIQSFQEAFPEHKNDTVKVFNGFIHFRNKAGKALVFYSKDHIDYSRELSNL